MPCDVYLAMSTFAIPVNNAERRQLGQQYIIPDTFFTTPPRLYKVMVAECLKSIKSADLQLSRIQVTVDDMKGVDKAVLTFLGNSSSQCTSLKIVGILGEHSKDLISFYQ